MKKKFISTLLCLCMAATMIACGSSNTNSTTSDNASNNSSDSVTLNIAYQYGLAYAPLIIAEKQELIEQTYREQTGKEVTIVWNQMSSGADINTAIASDSVQVGFMGIAPAITGVAQNVGYKICTNLSGQEHGLMTNDEKIKSFDDLIGSESQISVVNIGSIQHIILAKALSDNGYDAHALDANLVAMKHPDGMSSLETGNISCHLTTNPYLYKERAENNLHEIEAVSQSWNPDNSFIVGVASEELYNNNPELYKAFCDAIDQSINYLNDNIEDAAKITYEYNGNTEEDELKYLKMGTYSKKTTGIFELAKFMSENGFIDANFEAYTDLVYDNVTGD